MTPARHSRPWLRRRTLLKLCVLAPLAGGAGPAGARDDTYPDRPVTLVVPWPTGGTNDLLARLVGDGMSGLLNEERIIILNRAGASGTLGAGDVARATPDGYTLLWGSLVTHVLAPALGRPAITYDPVRSFAPVALLGEAPLVVFVNPAFPARSVAELVSVAGAAPGRYVYASPGFGTPAHLAAELLARAAGIEMVHLPYPGSGPALAAVLGGQVPIMVDLVPAALGHLRSGQLRGLGLTAARRSDVLPDLPTLAEAGFPGIEITAWNALFAPAGTPAAIIGRLADAAQATLAAPSMRARLTGLGIEVAGAGPDGLAARVAAERATWDPVLRSIAAQMG